MLGRMNGSPVETARQLVENVIEAANLVDLVISQPRQKGPDAVHKVTVRPVLLQGELNYQFTVHRGQQVLHDNLAPGASVDRIAALLDNQFRQAQFFTESGDYQVLVSKRGKVKILERPASKEQRTDLTHNRRKQYIIPENVPNPFLERLGVMNAQGQVVASRFDKFRQINRFLEMVANVVPALPKTDGPLRIVDFGCGKSYLTFALHHYLVVEAGLNVSIVGLDLKRDVIDHCSGLAEELCLRGLRFQLGDIAEFEAEGGVDMVVSLHACDTATDGALAQAVRWGAKVIMAVPCCQHELMHRISNPVMRPLEKHGIIKERMAALVTDSMRANLLEIMGYSTQIIEFVDTEHTPKNLLIRAIYSGGRGEKATAVEEYRALREFWGTGPRLESDLGDLLRERI